MLFDYDADDGPADRRGRRSPPCRPGSPAATSAPEILVSADGQFVYAGNRLHDSIGIFSVGPNGDLTYVGEEWTRGNYPRSFTFDPTGQFLYCCNQRGDNVTLPGGPQDRRAHLHRPLHPRRQPVVHRVPQLEKGTIVNGVSTESKELQRCGQDRDRRQLSGCSRSFTCLA